MSVSDWFSDDELLSQLKSFFDEDERDKIDVSVLGTMVNVGEDIMEVKVLGRVFRFSLVSCDVEEVTE